MRRTRKRIVGILFWLVAGGLGSYGLWQLTDSDQDSGGASATLASISRFVTRQEVVVSRIDASSRLRVGDPVFLADDAGDFHQVGRVSGVAERSGDREVLVTWHQPEIAADACQMFQYYSTGRLSEVVQTLMPPKKQERIRRQMAAAMAAHGEDVSRSFVPLVEQSLRESLPVIEDEFRRAVSRHRDEIDAAALRWNEEVVQDRLIPMARREILPIVKKHGQPPAEKIGREIWDRASLFRFGWRAIYDKTPLPQKDLLREEWTRFVEDEAVPVMEKHMDEIVVAIQRSVRDISANRAVRRELAGVAEEIASDPESRRLIQTILKETIVENEALRETWREVWSSQQAKNAFEVAGHRLEPAVRKIGDEIFGSETVSYTHLRAHETRR